MSKQKQRKRAMSVRVTYCETKTSWSGSAITFTEFVPNRANKEVTLLIEDPSDLTYIEEQLAKIRDGWKRQLGVLS